MGNAYDQLSIHKVKVFTEIDCDEYNIIIIIIIMIYCLRVKINLHWIDWQQNELQNTKYKSYKNMTNPINMHYGNLYRTEYNGGMAVRAQLVFETKNNFSSIKLGTNVLLRIYLCLLWSPPCPFNRRFFDFSPIVKLNEETRYRVQFFT